jgi:uncharacterized protein YciI
MLRSICLAALCAVLAAGCATTKVEEPTMTAQPKPHEAREEKGPETVFAVRFLPGPKWIAGKGANEQPGIMQHVQNLGALQSEHKLVLGGPFLDSSGGLAVVRAASLDEAKKLAGSDPCVASGVLVPEVHPWLLAYGMEDDDEDEDDAPGGGAR